MDFNDRLAHLNEQHVLPLTTFRQQLLQKLPAGSFVPNFDPLDGGVMAKVLLLLETPGRVPRQTKFTSLDNPSDTSKNLRPMVAAVGLARSDVLMWNLVPWDIGLETKVQATNSAHHSVGTPALLQLLELLAQLRAIVFFGTKSQVAIPDVRRARSDLPLIRCPHPSPTNLNTRPDSRAKIVEALSAAARAAVDG